MAITMKRRTFIKATLAGMTGLALGVTFDVGCGTRRTPSRHLTVWLTISPENEITVVIVKNEMGQGVSTTLPMIVAEELEADWTKIKVEFRPELDDYVYSTQEDYGTFDSMSIRTSYEPMRKVGAAAKEMLLTACAQFWGVDPNTLTAEDSKIFHPTKGTITYGDLVEKASVLPIPKNPKLKDPKDFKIIGRPIDRLNIRDQVEGSTIFGIDVALPEMMYAAVRQSPVFGGEVTNLDNLGLEGTKAERIVSIPNGIAVVGKSWWEAKRAIDSLDVKFSIPSEMENLNSGEISRQLADAMNETGMETQRKGEPAAELSRAGIKISSTFEVPFLDHAALEPINCTAHVTDDKCEIWVPTQRSSNVLGAAMKSSGLDASAITIHPMHIGGGFGRKYYQDFVHHAVLSSKAIGKPVKVIWSREEDMQHGYYRSVAASEITGGLDENGYIISWIAKLVGPKRGADWMNLSLACFQDLPYSIPNIEIRFVRYKSQIRNGYFRSVNMSHNSFFVESFMDELAHAASIDPLEFRLQHLDNNSPAKAVLKKVADMSNWGKPSVPNAAQGIALFDFTASDKTRTIVAHVAEVVIESGKIKIPKIFCVVDCGLAVNPDLVKAQIEGGVIFALTAAMYGEITIKNGAVKESNFDDYPLLELKEAPHVETEIINSGSVPSGVGEYGVPGTFPAVTNAIFTLTGQRIRKLPISKYRFS